MRRLSGAQLPSSADHACSRRFCCTADCAHQQDWALSLHRALQQNEDNRRVPSGGGGLIHLFVVRDSRRLRHHRLVIELFCRHVDRRSGVIDDDADPEGSWPRERRGGRSRRRFPPRPERSEHRLAPVFAQNRGSSAFNTEDVPREFRRRQHRAAQRSPGATTRCTLGGPEQGRRTCSVSGGQRHILLADYPRYLRRFPSSDRGDLAMGLGCDGRDVRGWADPGG